MVEKTLKGKLVKSRVSWYQHEVIVFGRLNLFNKSSSYRFRTKAISQKLRQIGAPLTEIVVNINNWDFCRSHAGFQARQSRSDRQGLNEHFLSIWKLKVIDHVDQKD